MIYIDKNEFQLKNTAVCLGKFEGLHRGHQKLITHSMDLKKDGYRPVVFTFAMNPRLLNNQEDVRQIYMEKEKRMILESMGVDTMICFPFHGNLFSMEPEVFVKEILLDKLDTKTVIVGEDFRFGKNRRGDIFLLRELGAAHGFKVKAFEKLTYQDEVISSSRIRRCLKEGKIEEANKMLGSPFSIVGEVLHGKKLGRTLGMPTINMIGAPEKLLPPNGVYASKTWIGGKEYPGITNIGVKPTIGAEEKKLVETFIFDFSGDLYGKELKVDLYLFKRPEQRFSSLKELKDNMEQDRAFGKAFFG